LFTGIVEEIGMVNAVTSEKLTIKASKILEDINPGDSIAINGVCLTVTDIAPFFFTAGTMPETLRRRNLGYLKTGDEVNLERAMKMGGRLGGHIVQGHIDSTAKVISTRHEREAIRMHFEVPQHLMRYIAVKGFIAVDGLSLTVIDVGENSFSVSLIEYTQNITTIGKRKVGDLVNIEVDVIAKYVESLSRVNRGGVTLDFLKEHGFINN
jgi:riboflavin synthase